MRVRRFAIPSSVQLPGTLVRVRLENPNHVNLQGAYGSWEYDTNGLAVVYINKKKPIKLQRYSLLHELQHVMVDYLDQAIEKHSHIFALARDVERRRKKRRARVAS
jgi:Zn-dependent peptidase ImmA (M78 family)